MAAKRGEHEYNTDRAGHTVSFGETSTVVRRDWTTVSGFQVDWEVEINWGWKDWEDWECTLGEGCAVRHAVEEAIAALDGDEGPLLGAKTTVLSKGHEYRGETPSRWIPIYSVTETEGGAERTRYQFAASAESTYGYSEEGERIGALVERDAPVLAGHFVTAPGVEGGLSAAQSGEMLLFLDSPVGYEAQQVVDGVPAMDGKGRYVEASR